jgi:hypothetical protein
MKTDKDTVEFIDIYELIQKKLIMTRVGLAFEEIQVVDSKLDEGDDPTEVRKISLLPVLTTTQENVQRKARRR